MKDKDLQIDSSQRQFYENLGRKLRSARIARNMSADELATAAGISLEQFYAYENAELAIPIYHLIPILKYLEYPPELDTLS